jgi:hypothetical protein
MSRSPSESPPAAHAGSRKGSRAGAWLVTGPLGRGLAFAVDLIEAIGRSLLRRAE